MSTIQTNNENQTVFNLSFDNGLPYKPVIRCETKVYHQKNREGTAIMHLLLPESPIDARLDEELKVIQGMRMDEDELFVIIDDYYIVGYHGSSLAWKSAEEGTLYVSIYKDENFIAGYKFGQGAK